jgi:hypothetical protein
MWPRDLHPPPAPRRIGCTGDRTAALEMLALRNIQIAPPAFPYSEAKVGISFYD